MVSCGESFEEKNQCYTNLTDRNVEMLGIVHELFYAVMPKLSIF